MAVAVLSIVENGKANVLRMKRFATQAATCFPYPFTFTYCENNAVYPHPADQEQAETSFRKDNEPRLQKASNSLLPKWWLSKRIFAGKLAEPLYITYY